ncbi:MAG: ATP-binding protein [Candidatus Kariarchaeaceae archaeon]
MTFCKCGEKSEYIDPFTPHQQNYCSTCFSNYLEKKMIRGFPRAARVHPIAIAVSGGKDSTTLLDVLLKNQKELKIPSVKAILLEEQIPEIEKQRQEIIEVLKGKYPDLAIFYKNYSAIYGYSLPELVKKSTNQNLRFTPCMMCGILKKNAIFRIGRELKIPYIALGTTLEDEASTILLNIIRGRPQVSLNENSSDINSRESTHPQLLKPLTSISEDLIRIYVDINNLPIITKSCPYAEQSIRSDLTFLMESLKRRDPRGSLIFNITKLKRLPSTQKLDLINCKRCQAPSNQSLCSACRIIAKF